RTWAAPGIPLPGSQPGHHDYFQSPSRALSRAKFPADKPVTGRYVARPPRSRKKLSRSQFHETPRLHHRAQNTSPILATTVRGCRKCVPLKVDRKLYSATLFVRLAISTDAVTRVRFSECRRSSVPTARLNTFRGFTRSGL